jgi:hypothetical protein
VGCSGAASGTWGELCGDLKGRVFSCLTINELARAASAAREFSVAFHLRVAAKQEGYITGARQAYGQPLIDTLALIIMRFCLGHNVYSGAEGFGPPTRAWIAGDGTFGLQHMGAKVIVSMKSADVFSLDLQPENRGDLREQPRIRFFRRREDYYEVLMNVGDLEQAERGLGVLLAACAQPSVREVLPGVVSSRWKLRRSACLFPVVRTTLYKVKCTDPAFSRTEALTAGVIPLAACLGDVGIVMGRIHKTVSLQTKVAVPMPVNVQGIFAMPIVFKEEVSRKPTA